MKQKRLTPVTLISSVSSLTHTAPTAGLTSYCITATPAHIGTAYAPKTCLAHYRVRMFVINVNKSKH